MSRKRRDHQVYIPESPAAASRYGSEPPVLNNTMMGLVGGLFMGALLGYTVGIQSARPAYTTAPPAAYAPVATPVTQGPSEDEIRAYRNVVNSDPANVRANVELANRLYDAGRYAEAIPYYQQAFTLEPTDINVSTDLGTALWYSGRPDEALAQYDKSLALNPRHPQTLFNVGIVKRDGKQDIAGAIAAWERLVASNPNSPDATRARQAITEARQQAARIPANRS